MIDEDVAIFLADNLLKRYPDLLATRYKADVSQMDGIDLLEHIAKRRSYKLKAGEWDMEKTAVTFLTEYRAGTIGRISLETPLSRKAMIEALVAKPADTVTEEEPTQE